MARQRSEKSIEAEKLYRSGMKLVDIAKTLAVPEGTVRRWKSNQGWDGKGNQTERSDSKANGKPNARIKNENNPSYRNGSNNGKPEPQKKKKNKHNSPSPFARLGNQNAIGNSGGAPRGNANGVRHGLYRKLMFENMTDDEKAFAVELDIDPITEILMDINLCNIQHARLMALAGEARRKPGGLLVDNITKTETVMSDGTPAPKGVPMKITQTSTISANDMLIRCDKEIQRYMRIKQKHYEILHRMGYDDRRIELELLRLEINQQMAAEEPEDSSSNFYDALNGTVDGTWNEKSEN